MVHQTKIKDLIESAQNTPKLQIIIVVGSKPDRDLSQKVYTFDELLNSEQNNESFDFPVIVPDDVAVIMYTSGSTGTPKGCVLTHKNLVSGAAGFQCLGCSITRKDFVFAFLPLAHIYQMCIEVIILAQGARVGYFSGSIPNLIQDIQCFRPTALVGVPRVFNKLVDTMKKGLSEKPKFLQSIVNFFLRFKADLRTRVFCLI